MAENNAKTAKPKMAKIKLELTRHEKNDEYVAINGKSYQIKRGEEVEVPQSVVEVLQNKERMLRKAMDFEAEAALRADAKELK
ncbi:MAG: hypothetical protein IKK29_03615 [Christensenellaceae bacterium]|nr:hypothetical protein [Christensenellaceae bacterium]